VREEAGGSPVHVGLGQGKRVHIKVPVQSGLSRSGGPLAGVANKVGPSGRPGAYTTIHP
jgi:hypothetical protein